MRIKMTAGWLLGVTLWVAPAWSLAGPNMAESMYNKPTGNFDKTQSTGEQFCWNGAFSLSDFLGQYEATGDTAWLDWGVKYYDALLGKMATGPDGYKGWIGPYIYDGHYCSYFNQVTAKRTPAFQRLDVSGEVEIPAVYAQFPLGDVRTVTFAAVLPPAFSLGEKAVIACKLSEPGDLDVALYSADGRTRLATLLDRREKGGPTGHEGVVAAAFPEAGPPGGAKLSPGEYRVRWTVAGDGYREFPFTLRPAKPLPATGRPRS